MQSRMFARDLVEEERKFVWLFHLIDNVKITGRILDVQYFYGGEPFTLLIQVFEDPTSSTTDSSEAEIPFRNIVYVQKVI